MPPDPPVIRDDQMEESYERNWQHWSLVVLGVGLVGLALAMYSLLATPAPLLVPLVYGLISFLVLVNFYIAEKQAMIEGLKQVLINQKIEAELNRELTLIDPVTEVYNRRYLRPLLAKEVSRVKRYGEEISVMMVDITAFRRVNASLGQTGGDVVLKQIARLLQTRLRNADIVVRFGGDEFVLILPGTDNAGSQTLSERLKQAVREWSKDNRMTEFGLDLAVGSACYVPDTPIDQILRLAEERMTQDKAAAPIAEKEAGTTPQTAQTTRS